MATRVKRMRPIRRAQQRRSILPWYFDLSGKGLFLLITLAASLLALLALAQTGRVVTAGSGLKTLQQQEEQLIWEQEALLDQIAQATDPVTLEQWAEEHGMELLEAGDIIYLVVPDRPVSGENVTPPTAQQP